MHLRSDIYVVIRHTMKMLDTKLQIAVIFFLYRTIGKAKRKICLLQCVLYLTFLTDLEFTVTSSI